MGKVWILDTETKGTGAHVAPLEDVQGKPEPRRRPASGGRKPRPSRNAPARRPAQRRSGEKRSTPLPPGQVRKKATGEIGQVQSVDPKAGTASVLWLKQGRTSTVPLTAISRR
jgi:hypothetical protein